MVECVFCEIVEGRRSAAVVHSGDVLIAFMDRYPINPGHVLAMPRRHYETIIDMPSGEVGPLFAFAVRVARAVKAATKADGFSIGQNNGSVANQLIPHVHVHIIPRYQNDSPTWGRPSRRLVSMDELNNWADAVRRELTQE